MSSLVRALRSRAAPQRHWVISQSIVLTRAWRGSWRGFAELSKTQDVPEDVVGEKVVVAKRSRNAMQQGSGGREWLVEFVPHEKWLNPLMGWTSSNDTATQVKMSFDTKEEAIAFCERQGYEFKVVEAKPKRSRVKSYADNYRADQYMPIQKKQ
eukprot:TRINITY_DN65718_c11_g3_i2.p2 TRINITY_DN65718_c11_g3~~TRINITY_DN65718_c11_g3_i2.p2  ORF type:complete len:161 (+),score=41.07 TRINITY_DN65718_c11_g3_i2:24-485(+)